MTAHVIWNRIVASLWVTHDNMLVTLTSYSLCYGVVRFVHYKNFWKTDKNFHPVFSWLSMVLRLRQHNIGYTADGFYRSDDPTNSVKALKEGG